MFCGNCGNQMQETAVFCTNCGAKTGVTEQTVPQIRPPSSPTQFNNVMPPYYQQININMPQEQKVKGQTPRVVIGIATIVLFFLMQLQSCVASVYEGFANILSETKTDAGQTGYFMSFFFLIGGIVSIVCRKSKGGSIAAGAIYAFCGIGTAGADFSIFQDLAVYCFLSFVFAAILIIGGIRQKPS